MRDKAQRIHLLPIEKEVNLNQLARLILAELIVKRGVTLCTRFQSIKKVINDFIKRHIIMHLNQTLIEILHVLVISAAFLTERHNIADELARCNNTDLHIGLMRFSNHCRIRIVVRIVDIYNRAVCLHNFIDDGRERRNQVEIKLPFQALLNNLHMQHPQEAAAEAEPERCGTLGLKGQRRIIQLQFFKRVTQIGIAGTVQRVDPAVDHRAGRAITRKRLVSNSCSTGDGISNCSIRHILDAGGKVTDVTGR